MRLSRPRQLYPNRIRWLFGNWKAGYRVLKGLYLVVCMRMNSDGSVILGWWGTIHVLEAEFGHYLTRDTETSGHLFQTLGVGRVTRQITNIGIHTRRRLQDYDHPLPHR